MKRAGRLLTIGVILTLLLAVGAPAIRSAQAMPMYQINGSPLRIYVTSDLGSLSVYRYQVLDDDYIPQYYSTFESYLRLGETVYNSYGSGGEETFGPSTGFVPVSMVQVNPWTIQTTIDAGTSGVRILQTISYVNGSPYYTKSWRISNLGSTTYTGVGFLHGGDTYFGGDDYSMGHWEPSLGMVYLTNPDPTIAGIMGFYGDRSTPASHYYEDWYGSVWSALESGHLDDTVRSDFIDAGYGLEWDRSTLAPGDVWTITSYEKWTEAGFVQVFAPQEKTGPIGTKVTLPFVVTTFGQGGGEELPAFRAPLAPTSVILDLSVASSLGWPVSLPQGSSVSVISGESATVNVEVMVPWTAHIGDRSSITLTASSRGEQASTGSDTTVVEAAASTAADVIPPVIILPAVEPRVNHSSLDLTLDVRDNSGQAKVTITDNGQVLVDPYQNGLLTYYLDLFEGTNDMEVIARDGAGNTSRARFTIVVDTHAPEVVLDPVPLSVSTSAITLSGAVSDRTSGLRSLMVNGTPVVPYADGHFTQTIQLVRGTNTILLEATDAVGNVGKTTLNVTYATPRVQGSVTIDLTVGKTGMIVGGIPQATDSAAVIRNGRTLLPVRSFIEAFGGSVQWNAKAGVTTVRLGGRTLQLTIGSNQAVLDGKTVAIDPSNAAVVPVIVDGRTLLPVRFVADSLGISVAWDAASQTVSLTYWP